MTEKKKEKLPRGRPKGTPNKRNSVVQETLDRLQCDPIEGMVVIAQFGRGRMEDTNLDTKERVEGAQLAGQMYREIAKYYAPQLKATEIKAEVITAETLQAMLPQINGLDDTDEPEFLQEQEKGKQ